MLITNNGTIEGVPYTSMIKKDGVWLYLLVCEVSNEHTDEELTTLFTTDKVEDDSIKAEWRYTQFNGIKQGEGCKYVWLTYTERIYQNEEALAAYEAALNTLGVVTQEEVTVDAK